jgi:hypothetical protein
LAINAVRAADCNTDVKEDCVNHVYREFLFDKTQPGESNELAFT